MSLSGATLSPCEGVNDPPYIADVAPSLEAALDVWDQMAKQGAALAFQRRDWLEPWQDTIGRRPNLELLPITIRDAAGRPVAALPLVCEKRGIKRIGFADGGLADYNAPVLTREAPQDRGGAKLLWRALLKALPSADVIRFERMPTRVGGVINPLSMLPGARPSSADGLMLAMEGGYDAWRKALPRRYRMELGRCARLFDGLPKASFDRGTENGAAVFEALERLQRERISGLGLPYSLDHADAKSFYRRLGVQDGGAGILTALTVDGEVIAALFGLRHGSTFVMLRIGASPAFSRMSPARDLITRTMEQLNAEGVTTFDFGLGDYIYKRKLGGTPHHLVDVVAARTPLGLFELGAFRLRAHVRGTPWLREAAQRLRSDSAQKAGQTGGEG